MARVDGTAQKIQSKPAWQQVQNVGSVRSRPLAGKSFYLDLASGKTLEFLEKSVKRFGGVVESFLSKEVMCVVSDNQEAQKESWGGKPATAALRNTLPGMQTSAGLRKGHRDPSYKPADGVLVTRGKALLQKAIGTQGNTRSSNSVLASARSWGIQVMPVDDMFLYLQWLDSKRCRPPRQMKLLRSRPQSARKVMRLQSPFLKVEDESRRLRPFLQQFKNFPELCFTELRRRSPFDPPRSPASSKTPEGHPAHSNGSSDCCLVPKRHRGYCECCEETFVELQMHLQSARHMTFVLDASHYAPVDSLISQMADVFAGPSCSSLPPREPPASGDRSGFQEDVLQSVMAPSGQPRKPCLSGGQGSGARPVSPGSSTLLSADQTFRLWTELPGETLSAPVLLPSPSLQALSGQADGSSSGAQDRGREGAGAGAPLEPAACPEVGSWPAPQQKELWAPPALPPSRPRKRKLPCSPRGQVKKRPALSQLPPDTKALPGSPPVGTTEGSSSQECGSRTGPGCPQRSAVPVAEPHHCLRASPQFLREGSALPPGEQPAPQLEQRQGSVLHPCEERHAQTPHNAPRADAGLDAPSAPTGTRMSSQLLGSGAWPCPPGVGPSPFIEALVPAQSGLGLPPLPCSEEPSSSESEWDGPLLCAPQGPSRFPLERPVDSALRGTCVSMRDRGYEAHLRSVLWQALEPHEARKGASNGGHGHGEVLWTPFNSLGSQLDRLGPFPLNEPTPRF